MPSRLPERWGGRLFVGRRRAAHATVVAYVALFVTLAGGTAYATSHYLITSTKQLKPSVRRALRGTRGPRGLVGAIGESGATGATGAPGPLLTVLPSGATETGVYSAEGTATTVGDPASSPISFTLALASSPTPTIVSSGTTTDCPGSVHAPSAAPGSLCVYVGDSSDVGEIATYDPFGNPGGTASQYGAGVVIDSAGAGNFYSDGTWAVTAP